MSKAVSIPDTSRRTSTDLSRRTSLCTTTAAPLSSSNRFTRSSSVSKLPAADFKLNLTNALVKKLSSCHRKEPFSVTETGGGFRFYFQAGFFEILRTCLGSCFKAIAPTVAIRDSPDACGKVYTTTYSVEGAYTLSLYMAGSSGLLNGKDTALFLENHLKTILQIISMSFPTKGALLAANAEIAGTIEAWKNDALSGTRTPRTSKHNVLICIHCNLPNEDRLSHQCTACGVVAHRKCAGRKKADKRCLPCELGDGSQAEDADLIQRLETLRAAADSPPMFEDTALILAHSTASTTTSTITLTTATTKSALALSSASRSTVSAVASPPVTTANATAMAVHSSCTITAGMTNSVCTTSTVAAPDSHSHIDDTPASSLGDLGATTVVSDDNLPDVPVHMPPSQPVSAPQRSRNDLSGKNKIWNESLLVREKEVAANQLELMAKAKYVKDLERQVREIKQQPPKSPLPSNRNSNQRYPTTDDPVTTASSHNGTWSPKRCGRDRDQSPLDNKLFETLTQLNVKMDFISQMLIKSTPAPPPQQTPVSQPLCPHTYPQQHPVASCHLPHPPQMHHHAIPVCLYMPGAHPQVAPSQCSSLVCPQHHTAPAARQEMPQNGAYTPPNQGQHAAWTPEPPVPAQHPPTHQSMTQQCQQSYPHQTQQNSFVASPTHQNMTQHHQQSYPHQTQQISTAASPTLQTMTKHLQQSYPHQNQQTSIVVVDSPTHESMAQMRQQGYPHQTQHTSTAANPTHQTMTLQYQQSYSQQSQQTSAADSPAPQSMTQQQQLSYSHQTQQTNPAAGPTHHSATQQHQRSYSHQAQQTSTTASPIHQSMTQQHQQSQPHQTQQTSTVASPTHQTTTHQHQQSYPNYTQETSIAASQRVLSTPGPPASAEPQLTYSAALQKPAHTARQQSNIYSPRQDTGSPSHLVQQLKSLRPPPPKQQSSGRNKLGNSTVSKNVIRRSIFIYRSNCGVSPSM